jgi:hypothetical protein
MAKLIQPVVQQVEIHQSLKVRVVSRSQLMEVHLVLGHNGHSRLLEDQAGLNLWRMLVHFP